MIRPGSAIRAHKSLLQAQANAQNVKVLTGTAGLAKRQTETQKPQLMDFIQKVNQYVFNIQHSFMIKAKCSDCFID